MVSGKMKQHLKTNKAPVDLKYDVKQTTNSLHLD